MHSWFRSKVHVVLSALLIAASMTGSPLLAIPATAITPCTGSNCARLTISWVGMGNARVVDDQGQIDCASTGGTVSGTCEGNYVWSKLSGQLDVTLRYTADNRSFVCVGDLCGGVGDTFGIIVPLSNGSDVVRSSGANVAAENHVQVTPSGDGAGRVTSVPAGIDCRFAAGVTSGTCGHVWYTDWGVAVAYALDPGDGNQVCWYGCKPVGATMYVNEPAGMVELSLKPQFVKAHPWLSVSVSGQGTVATSPSGISCPSTCTSYFPPNTSVTVNAAAKVGSHFDHWTGACSAYGATCNVALGTTDVSTTAVFASNATPAPTSGATTAPTPTPFPTAAPTRTPTPASTPTPTRSLTPGSSPASDVTSSPAPPAEPTAPGANPPALGTPAAGEPAGSAGAAGSDTPSTAGPSQVAVAAGSAGAGATPVDGLGNGHVGPAVGAENEFDPWVIVFLLLGAGLVLLLGLLVGVRAGRARRPPAGV